MTTTTRFRFPDEMTAVDALAQYRRDGEGWITGSHAHALDPIGVMYEPAEWDADGEPLPAVAMDGWHVNLIGDVPAAAEPYIVTPGEPLRVWAGESAP